MTFYNTPDTIVRKETMGPHFDKYHLGDGRVLHHIKAADDLHFHDHPYPFRSSILSGGYIEEVAEITEDGNLETYQIARTPGITHESGPNVIHKIVRLLNGVDCWTLIEPGKKNREPGFYRVNEAGVWHRYWHQQDWTLLKPAIHADALL